MPTYNLTLTDSVSYPLSLEDSVGPWLWGILLSTLLVGILVGQVTRFVRSCKAGEFARHERWIVGIAFSATLSSWASQLRVAHWLFIANFGQPGVLLRMGDQAYFVHLASTAVIVASYAIRAWRLNGQSLALGLVFGLLICVVAASRLALAILYGRASLKEGEDIVSIVDSLQIPLALSFWSSAVVDVVLFAAISYRLANERRRNAYAETDNLLVRIFQLSLTTSALTTVAAVLVASLLLTKGPASLWSVLIIHTSSRLFACSLMFTLNARGFLKDGASQSYARRKARFAHTDVAFKSNHSAHNVSGLQIDLQVHRVVDGEGGDKSIVRAGNYRQESRDSLAVAQMPTLDYGAVA